MGLPSDSCVCVCVCPWHVCFFCHIICSSRLKMMQTALHCTQILELCQKVPSSRAVTKRHLQHYDAVRLFSLTKQGLEGSLFR